MKTINKSKLQETKLMYDFACHWIILEIELLLQWLLKLNEKTWLPRCFLSNEGSHVKVAFASLKNNAVKVLTLKLIK